MEEIAFFAGGMCNNEESNEPDDSSKDSEFAEGTYTINGNKLIMKLIFNDETEFLAYTIKSVVKNKKLVLTDENSYIFDYMSPFGKVGSI